MPYKPNPEARGVSRKADREGIADAPMTALVASRIGAMFSLTANVVLSFRMLW